MSMQITIYLSLQEAGPFLQNLADKVIPFTFNIETYDAGKFPSRKTVSFDPCHPDFRVRGLAIALSKDSGAWIELGGLPRTRDDAVLASLAAAFGSDAPKGAFNGGFDENGLVYPGWVPAVRNRARDAMLGAIALGDGTDERLTLEHIVKVLLPHHDYQWGSTDKGKMRDLPIEQVAHGAVRDACYTHELCDLIDEMAARGEYIRWSTLARHKPAAQGRRD